MSVHILTSPILKSSRIETPLGSMLAIADDKVLYFLAFDDHPKLRQDIEKLRILTKSADILTGITEPLHSIEDELNAYFSGRLKTFQTLYQLEGSAFQKLVWKSLLGIPYGETLSYAEQAKWVGKPTAYRAVANANAANPISIVIPCHRVIRSNGEIGGYGGGIDRKRWLLHHEKT